jgi:hypothetical protein
MQIMIAALCFLIYIRLVLQPRHKRKGSEEGILPQKVKTVAKIANSLFSCFTVNNFQIKVSVSETTNNPSPLKSVCVAVGTSPPKSVAIGTSPSIDNENIYIPKPFVDSYPVLDAERLDSLINFPNLPRGLYLSKEEIDSIEYGDCIGKGKDHYIVKVTFKKNTYALKVFDCPEDDANFFTEARIMASFNRYIQFSTKYSLYVGVWNYPLG